MKNIILTIIMILGISLFTNAQTAGYTDVGLWNDIQVSHSINKQLDVITGLRFDTKKNSEVFAEQRVYGGFNIKSKNGRFTVSPWLIFLKNHARTPFYELRPQVTVGYKFTTSNKINVTPRVRLEYHMKHKVKDSGRVIPTLAFDKKLTKNYGVFQITEFWIPLYNSKDVAKYRQRYFFGVTRQLNKKLSLDMFYLLQKDQQVNPKMSHKFGLTWKIKL